MDASTAVALPTPAVPVPLSGPAGAAPAAPGAAVGARWAQIAPAQRLRLGVGAAALIAVVAALSLWAGRPDYRVLYSNLPDKEAGAVVAQLAQQNIPYQVSEGGASILVPAERVHEVRMKLATAGLPKAAVVGNELLDNPRLGQTDRQERLMVQRALEGELVRSISAIDGVQAVRVHLALPNQNGFFREQQKPSASVVLTLQPGRTLDKGQVAGIVHLVSSSVPEMNPKAVSVIDQSGALVSRSDEGQDGLDAQQLAFVAQVEATYLKRVQSILEPAVGAANLRATVTADVDFTQSESTSEQYRPNQGSEPAAVRSQQVNEQNGQGGSATPAGVPGAATNQPPTPATAPIAGASAPLQAAQGGSAGGGASRRDSTVNYEVDKTVRVTRNAMGSVKRINAAVVVNHRSQTEHKGKVTSVPLTPEELDKLTALVREAVGYNAERGDSIKVVNVPFQVPAAPEEAATPLWQQPWLMDLLRTGAAPLALALVALGVIFGLVRPVLSARTAAVAAPAGQTALLDAVVGDEAGASPTTAKSATDAGEVPLLAAPPEFAKLEAARRLARDNPVAVANVMRDWVSTGT